jgi:hypothetical protein
MPLTAFQKEVARLLARNRTPESHVAGGAVFNRGESGLRISDDLDVFHDLAALVAASAETDAHALRAAHYSVEWLQRGEGTIKAQVTCGDDHVRLDWTTDSAFRFFPVQPDEDFGFCLHRADLATNKILALAGRSEMRDFLDTLLLDQTYLSLGALVWAACGKDPGFTPDLLLDETNRHSRYQESDLLSEHLVRPVALTDLKKQWLSARAQAERLIKRLPPAEVGCLYLAADHRPVTPDPGSPEFHELTRHYVSNGGAWPRIS